MIERENSSSQTTEEKLTIHLRSLPNDCSLNITSLNRPDFHRRCRDCRSSSSPRRTIFTRLYRSTSSRDGRSDERRGRLYGRSSRYQTPPPRYLRSSADTPTLRSDVDNDVRITAKDVEPDTLSLAPGLCVGDVVDVADVEAFAPSLAAASLADRANPITAIAYL